jgi:FkbM family methyltransferase
MPTRRQRLTAFFARWYPLLSGCGTFANSQLLRRVAGEEGGLAWGRLHDGSAILVPIDDYIGRAIYFVGDLDRKVTRVIKRIVSQGDVVLDVGANLGLVTMQLARLVGDRGRVHAFEPNPAMVDLLSQTVERNAARNVEIHTFALGPKADQLHLRIPRDHAGRASFVRNQSFEWNETVVVPVRTLSSVVKDLNLGRVRLLKIDVEGFELEVFQGAEEWMSSNPPDFILFESNEPRCQNTVDPVMKFLEDHDYQIYVLNKSMLFLSLSPCTSGEDPNPDDNDFLAVRKTLVGDHRSWLGAIK